MAFFREQLDIVNHVRDQEQADVHIIINSFAAGSSGRTYEIELVGLHSFANMNNVLSFDAAPTLSDDEIRKGLLEKLKLGMVAYLVHTSMSESLEVSVHSSGEEKDPATEIVDPWNFWVIELSANGNFNKESQRSTFRNRLGLEINRVTDDWRILQNSFFNNTYQRFEQEEGDPIVSNVRWMGIFGKVV
ncbi:MAG: hypothetical protein AAFO94_23190, partial [Bacteroidota bacterium]